MRNIMKSSQNELLTAESGFDSNWTFLQSKLVFEKQKYFESVSQVGSHKCGIQPKNLLLMPNSDLIVSSYHANGVKVRAFTASPFRKISKQDYDLNWLEHQDIYRQKINSFAREYGVQNFLDLRFMSSPFRLIQETMSQKTII